MKSIWLSMAVCAAVCANASAADLKDLQRGIQLSDRAVLASPLTTFIEADTGRGAANTRALIDIAGKNVQNAALSNFTLNFLGSDHKIRELGVLQSNSKAAFHFSDRDGDDRFVARAGWHTSEKFIPYEVSAVGGGELSIRLNHPVPADSVVLLKGFKFERARGTDANVRLIGVQIMDDQTIRVSLVDDQGADFRNFGEVVGRAFSLGMFVEILTGFEAVKRLNEGEFGQDRNGQNRLRRFAVTVQYVVVPKAAISDFNGAVSGTSRVIAAGRAPAQNAKVALRGFRFYFGNSDHHLKTISVKLPSDPSQPAVSYEDGNADDPIAWAVDYMTLK
jgi:hypothetical protein